MRILLIGNTGQLGWELERTLAPLGELNACDFPQIDLADSSGIRQFIRQCQPDVLINAAAYTAVDKAEIEPDAAQAINAAAPGVLAEEARQIKAAFIHFSTDYVFDGQKGSPYLETDPPNPLNVYGRTKLAGEQAVQQAGAAYLILRTSWVYSLRRESFVTKVLAWARKQTSLKLVSDQVSSPTWSRMLAEATSQLIISAKSDLYSWFIEHHGLYHLAGSGYCSRYEWGQEILKLDPLPGKQVAQAILPALTAEFPTPARRPLFSALSCDHFYEEFSFKLPEWRFALKLAMESA
jgi:dTDP-4-dehydrorhamnose reductase